MLNELDTIIEARREELRCLEVARAVIAGAGPAATPQRALPPAPDPAERRARIAARATKPAAAPPSGKRGKYQRRDVAFKLKVLEQLAAGAKVRDVLDEHGLHGSQIATWRRQAAAGTLVEAAPVDDTTPIAGLDNDVVITEGDAEEGDLVDAMAEGGAAGDDDRPFGADVAMPLGMAAAAPSQPSRGRPSRW